MEGLQPVSEFRYRAFISYSHRDSAWADWLHKALETYRVPSRLVGQHTAAGTIPRRLIPVFRDREELSSSPELGSKINEALRQSENLVVICSPASATSRWVDEEVLAYKRMGRGEHIFCLIVDGEPNVTDMPDRVAAECFCPALRFHLDADGQPTSERTEPIAADVREGKDGKSNARLKLIAGMLGVGFDTLKQREQRRQLQRMTAITALAVAVMAVTAVLAVSALISRHAAVIAQQAAERRQKQAEDLVGFMLGDLNDKLAQMNRLDIIQAVDDKAMTYFESLSASDVNDTALAQRAKALEKIGIVRNEQGQPANALTAFEASNRIFRQLAAAAPADPESQLAYSRSLAWIGMIHYGQGDFSAATRDWRSARQTLQPALQQSPGNLSLQAQLAYMDGNLDHMLSAQGHPDEALALARERLELQSKLAKAKPTDATYAGGLGDAHNELGRLALLRGDLAGAIAEYHADDTIETTASTQHPQDNNQRDDMARVRAILGRTLALTGDTEAGVRALQQAVDIGVQLVAFEPHDTGYQDRLALYSLQLARLQRLTDNTSAAAASNAKAITLLDALVRNDPGNHDWQGDYAEALIEQAAQQRLANRSDAARASIQQALDILTPMLAKHPDERAALLSTMNAQLLLASLTADPQAARRLREQAVDTLQATKVDRGDPRLLALQVEALLALDRKSDTQPLIKQLWDEGYRDPAFVALLQREHISYSVKPAITQGAQHD